MWNRLVHFVESFYTPCVSRSLGMISFSRFLPTFHFSMTQCRSCDLGDGMTLLLRVAFRPVCFRYKEIRFRSSAHRLHEEHC